MIRHFALLATTAAIVGVPQFAQAGCAGTGCNSLSTTANYLASDKKVRATVTNKDATSPIHLKFCVNVDYHCNPFDVTINPHETVTKDVAHPGSKPQITAVDVVVADFPPARASSGSGAAGSSGSGATASNSGASVTLDTPRGKLMVLASKQSVVAPTLAKISDYYTKLGTYYPDALERARTMHELAEKLGSIKNAENEVAQNRNKDGGRVKDQAHIARGAELSLSHFASTVKLVQTNADWAMSNLKISEDDLRQARDMDRARKLRAASEKTWSGVNVVLKAANQVADAVIIALPETDPGSKINASIATISRLMDLVGTVDPLTQEAARLEDEARQIGMDNAEKKLAAAKPYMTQLKQQLAELQAKFPEYQELVRNTRGVAEDSYDKIAKNPKSGSRFNFDDLQKAIDACQMTIDYTKKVYEYAYGVRDQIKALGRAGDDAAWMAFPGEGRKVLGAMYDEAGPAFDWAVKERQIAEALLKRFNDMGQVARNTMQ
jgi:hypothetical protein